MSDLVDLLEVRSPHIAEIIDGWHISRGELLRWGKSTAVYVRKEFPDDEVVGVYTDNNLYGLILMLGVLMAGKTVVGLPPFMKGPLLNSAIEASGCEAFIGYGTDLDHSSPGNLLFQLGHPDDYVRVPLGNIAVFSSGTTGAPKLQSITTSFLDQDNSEKVTEIMNDALGIAGTKSIYYPAPMATTLAVHLMLIAMGHVVVSPSKPLTHAEIVKEATDSGCTVLAVRPSMIEKMMEKGITNLGTIKALMSSTGRLDPRHVAYAKKIGVEKVVDVYSTTDLGFVGVRDSLDKPFTLNPAVKATFESDGTWTATSPGVNGVWVNGVLEDLNGSTHLDDIVEECDGGLRLIRRSPYKVKVSGFTVVTPIVRDAILGIDGISDAVVYSSRVGDKDTLVAEYTGRVYTDDRLTQILATSLPSYSIPKVIRNVDQIDCEKGVVVGNEHFAVPSP